MAVVFSQRERGVLLQYSNLVACGQHTRQPDFDAELRIEETGHD